MYRKFYIFRAPSKMMRIVIALSIWVYVVNTIPVDKFINNTDVSFGFGSD